MKIKFWQFEYDFDKDDAKIVVPLILLLVAISFTGLNREMLLVLSVIYYLLYFFLKKMLETLQVHFVKLMLRCPKCKSRKVLLQGYQTYKSDECHAYYYCTTCEVSSIMTEGGLV